MGEFLTTTGSTLHYEVFATARKDMKDVVQICRNTHVVSGLSAGRGKGHTAFAGSNERVDPPHLDSTIWLIFIQLRGNSPG